MRSFNFDLLSHYKRSFSVSFEQAVAHNGLTALIGFSLRRTLVFPCIPAKSRNNHAEQKTNCAKYRAKFGGCFENKYLLHIQCGSEVRIFPASKKRESRRTPFFVPFHGKKGLPSESPLQRRNTRYLILEYSKSPITSLSGPLKLNGRFLSSEWFIW